MTYINRAQIYLDLIQKILKKNKNIFSIDMIRDGLSELTEEDPILSKLTIDNKFHLTSKLPDFEGALNALKAFMEFLFSYIQTLVPEDELDKRFKNIVNDFVKQNSHEIAISDFIPYLPTQIFQDKVDQDKFDINIIRQETPKKQVAIIFETLLTGYLQELLKMNDKNLFFSEVLKLKNSFSIFKQFVITKDGIITIFPTDDDNDHNDDNDVINQMVKDYSEVLNHFVNISAYNVGSDIAFGHAQKVIKPILECLEDLPEKFGILNYILNGTFAICIPTGISGFDAMLRGGIPLGKAVLIQAPAGSEKNFLISHFVKNGLERNSNFIVFLSKIPPRIFNVQLKTMGIKSKTYEKDGRLKIIDWYSWLKSDDQTASGSDHLIGAYPGLADLWKPLQKSFSTLKHSPTNCAVLNILTSTLSRFDFEQVYDFILKFIIRLKENHFTSIFLIEKDAHDGDVLGKLSELFDGVIDIENEEMNGKVITKIQILSMDGTDFDPKFKPLTLDGTKLIVSET